MPTIIKHYCDRCSELIERDRSLLIAEAGPLATTRPEIELCVVCASALVTWLSAPNLTHPPAAAAS